MNWLDKETRQCINVKLLRKKLLVLEYITIDKVNDSDKIFAGLPWHFRICLVVFARFLFLSMGKKEIM